MSKGNPVHLNERIRAGSGSSGQFILLDNSKIAVGARATIVLDDFVVSSGRKAKRVSIKVLKGALRFSSGRSASKAYKIKTPTATLGVRGTLFEVAVTRGTTNVLLLRGSMDVCGRGGCRRLRGPCSYAVAKRGRAVKVGNTKKGSAASRRGVKARTFPWKDASVACSGVCGHGVPNVLML